MVSSNSVTPSRAKYSACMGISTVSAATSALRVSRSSAGGQSMTMNWNCSRSGCRRVPQAVLAVLERHQFDVGADQVLVRGDGAEVVELGGLASPARRDLAHDDLIGAVAVGIAQEAEAAGGVGLGIAIDQQRARRREEANDAARLMAVVVLPTPPF